MDSPKMWLKCHNLKHKQFIKHVFIADLVQLTVPPILEECHAYYILIKWIVQIHPILFRATLKHEWTLNYVSRRYQTHTFLWILKMMGYMVAFEFAKVTSIGRRTMMKIIMNTVIHDITKKSTRKQRVCNAIG